MLEVQSHMTRWFIHMKNRRMKNHTCHGAWNWRGLQLCLCPAVLSPKCRHEYSQSQCPTRYYCFCGKQPDPQPDPWLVPHSCGDVCGRRLNPECGHSCLLLCHPGMSVCVICPDMSTCPVARWAGHLTCVKDKGNCFMENFDGKEKGWMSNEMFQRLSRHHWYKSTLNSLDFHHKCLQCRRIFMYALTYLSHVYSLSPSSFK